MASHWAFFAIVFALTWVFWLPAVFVGDGHASIVTTVLILAGGVFGKLIPAIAIPFFTLHQSAVNDYWERVWDVKRLGVSGFVLSLALFPAVSLLAVGFVVVCGSQIPSFTHARELLDYPFSRLLPFAIGILLYGPLPEELGWRGYELDRLQERYSPLVSSLVLGMMWGLWHLPLFFIAGTYQNTELVFGSSRFLLWWPDIIATSIIITYVYNATNRSTLGAILLHFSQNFVGEFFDLPVCTEMCRSCLTILVAVFVSIIWTSPCRRRHLRHSRIC